MYRVLVAALLAVLLAGCSMANSSLTAGFADSGQPTSSVAPRAPRTQTANAASISPSPAPRDDKIPKGTFEKAPQGALADRDYGGTRLDPEKARELINAYRKEKGLKPLRLNIHLTEAAKAHCRDLAKWDRISHFGSDGSNPWDRVKRVGYSAKLAAENAFPYEPLTRPQNLVKTENLQDRCEHDWQWFKERVPVSDDGKDLVGGHTRIYNHNVQFWFKTRACVKCKKKVRSGLYHATV